MNSIPSWTPSLEELFFPRDAEETIHQQLTMDDGVMLLVTLAITQVRAMIFSCTVNELRICRHGMNGRDGIWTW
jgi:hypothetical protein